MLQIVRKISVFAIVMCLSAVLLPSVAFAAEGNALEPAEFATQTDANIVAQGTDGTCKWSIDTIGNLVIEPTNGKEGTLQSAPWKNWKAKILFVQFWGTVHPGPNGISFSDYTALKAFHFNGLDTSKLTDMTGMFSGCSSLQLVDFSGADTSGVKNMSNMFDSCTSLASINLSGLNTSNVSNMSEMFRNCKALKSIDLSKLDTSSVTDMSGMFMFCSALESINMTGIDTSKVTNLKDMFNVCKKLQTIDLSTLNLSSVKTAETMFYYCESLKSAKFASLKMPALETMKMIFYGCAGLGSVDLSNVDVPRLTDISMAFFKCGALTSVNMSGINTPQLANMRSMFDGCTSLPSVDLADLDTANVTNMASLFSSCSSLKSIGLSIINTSSVETMNGMFSACSSLTSLDLSKFNTSSVTDMTSMFTACSSLKSLNLASFDTSKASKMYSMFANCTNLESLDLSKFNTSKATSMKAMFYGCASLKSLDVSNFDTSSVTDMQYMFYQCASLSSLDLSSFDTSKVTTMDNMFYCPSTTRVILGAHVTRLEGFPGRSNTRWVSTKENKEFGAKDILASRLGVADTYTAVDVLDIVGRDELPEGYVVAPVNDLTGGDGNGGSEGQPADGNADNPVANSDKSDLATYVGTAESAGFSDLMAYEWYMSTSGGAFPGTNTLYLDYTISKGLMSGYTGTTRFAPNDPLSRGMAATIIYRMATKAIADTTNNYVDAGFPDVYPGDWYAAAVKWCSENGIVTGYQDGSGRFGPNDNVTREQLAAMIFRYCTKVAKMEGVGSDVKRFPDGDRIATWARDAAAFCAAYGIITGRGDTGAFDPQGDATRCQMAKIIAVTARMLE